MGENRNATSSWSGYNHQGYVGLYVCLKMINEAVKSNDIKDMKDLNEHFNEYEIRFEIGEDFDILKDGDVLSRHQVKAKLDATTANSYKNLCEIEYDGTIGDKNKKEKIGFDVFYFDKNKNKKKVDKDSRFLHTICEVKYFGLSKDDFKKKQEDKEIPRNVKHVENKNKLTIYEYGENKYCSLCSSDVNDVLAINNLIYQELSMLEKEELIDSCNTDSTIGMFAEKLNEKIGVEHGNKGIPKITFAELLKCIKDYEGIEKDNIQRLKVLFTKALDTFEDEQRNKLINLVNEINTLEQQEFKKFICIIFINKDMNFNNKNEILLNFSIDNIRDFFYEFLLDKEIEDKKYDIEHLGYNINNRKYILSAIRGSSNQKKKIKEMIIKNSKSELINCLYESEGLITEKISYEFNNDDIIAIEEDFTSNVKSVKKNIDFTKMSLKLMECEEAKEILKNN